MNRIGATLAASAVALASHSAAVAQDFAIHAGRIFTGAGSGEAVIDGGYVLVRGGRIAAVGTDIDIPAGVPIHEMPDAVLMPGIVSASSGAASPHTGDRSIGAAFSAIDGVDMYLDTRSVLEAGVTTAHASPGWHRLVSGRGAVVRMLGAGGFEILDADSDLTINLSDRADNPPVLEEVLIAPGADNEIEPGEPQRPSGRIGRRLALKEAVEEAIAGPEDIHAAHLARVWNDGLPLRIQSDKAADLLGAVSFLEQNGKAGYIVGGMEAARVAGRLADAGVALAYTIDPGFGGLSDLGDDPDVYEPSVADLAALDGLDLALTVRPGTPLSQLRLAAATALRAGIDEVRLVNALTRTPAEMLGVADRVGSLEPGKDADIVVLSGNPGATSSHVRRVFVQGEPVFRALAGDAVVISGGTVWLAPGQEIEDGSILIENGKIAAVGKRVPHPPAARMVRANPGSFVAPGFIDTLNRLGLDGDRSDLSPELSMTKLIGAPDLSDTRLARAGVTTVVQSPYRFNSRGSRASAVKTFGAGREDRIVDEIAALAFDVTNIDPREIGRRLEQRIEAGREYTKEWEDWRGKYDDWVSAREAGEVVEDAEPETESTGGGDDASGPDPLTGTWQVTLSGGPLPRDLSGPVAINLDGTEFEGKMLAQPIASQPHRIVGTIEDGLVTGRIEIETPQPGVPEFSGEVIDDVFTGELSFGGLTLTLNGERTSTDAVQFSVGKRERRTTGKDGEPLPPLVKHELEPIRSVLEGNASLLVRADTAARIRAVVKAVAADAELPLVLLGAEQARDVESLLKEHNVGVVLPEAVARSEARREFEREYVQSTDLSRRGIPITFGSGAEDGGRALPMIGLLAVERGLGPDQALWAMTAEAARLFKIDDRVGSIETGKDGDIVIYSGHPFEAGSTVERVFVNGEEVRP